MLCYHVYGFTNFMESGHLRKYEISDILLKVSVGYHHLIQYSHLASMRMVYSKYVIGEMNVNPNDVIVLSLYYDTTDNVRQILE